MSSDSEEDRLPPVVAPSPHVHAHDVAALGKWMENVTDALESSLADAKKKSEKAASTIESSKAFSFVAVQLVEELYAKGKKFTVFHNELARQTAAHCPRVAR